MLKKNKLSTFLAITFLISCSSDIDDLHINKREDSQTAGSVNTTRLKQANNEPAQWMTHGGSLKEQRFSQLDQINTNNVDQLGLAWHADFESNRGQESTPLFVDGVLYVTEAWSKVHAFSASDGELIWSYDPKISLDASTRGCCDVVNRGVAVYEGKVYLAAYDGRLIALNANNGKVVWVTQTVNPDLFYTSTGAPRVANGNIIIGNAGSEYKTRGYISAYDAQTGTLKWRFYTVPGNPEIGFENDAMELAAETWSGQWWEYGGGGGTWDAITYDPETNLIYFGVGNGSPWNSQVRSPDGGDNLFISSIVAVTADTGEYKWHFQGTPNDEWDYDATAQITIADIQIDGQKRHTIMQAPKNGFFYLLDASTGELLKANNFVNVNWASGYDLSTGKPNIDESLRYSTRTTPVIVQPGSIGGHNYHPMSYNTETGLLYIPAIESSTSYVSTPEQREGRIFVGVDRSIGDYAYDLPSNKIARGMSSKLVAWDPVEAKEVWTIENVGAGGVLTTAGGLLVKANGQDEELAIYNADDGMKLWSYDTKANASPGPISYSHDNQQYIAQVVGGGGFGGYYAPNYSRLLVFKLEGNLDLPEKTPFTQRPFAPPPSQSPQDLIASGAKIYSDNCSLCHGINGANRGKFPDLRRTPLLHSIDSFNSIVITGNLESRGMPSFNNLDTKDTDAILSYLIAISNDATMQETGNNSQNIINPHE